MQNLKDGRPCRFRPLLPHGVSLPAGEPDGDHLWPAGNDQIRAPALEELKFSPEQVITTLEMRMKCGVGKCGRCNIGSLYVCKDGPVFTWPSWTPSPMMLSFVSFGDEFRGR